MPPPPPTPPASDLPGSIDRQAFTGLVHDALGKLYDTPALQQQPLAALLDPAQTSALLRGQKLRRMLLASIQSLHPTAGVPATSPDWRAYHLLEKRYIEGLDPNEAMRQLGLAKSQFFREQARGIEAVAADLWGRYMDAQAAPADVSRPDLIRAEAERLAAHVVQRGVDDRELLADLSAILTPLAAARGVSLRLVSLHALSDLMVDRVILRQTLLVACNALLNVPGVQSLVVDSPSDGRRGVCATGQPAPGAAIRDVAIPDEALALCRSLVEASGGTTAVTLKGDALEVQLTWASNPLRTLLVVDDNAGLADLFRRYLVGHPWRVLSACNGVQARELLAGTRPDVILLDVLMPQEDGWEFLLSLKSSESFRTVPVVVCSVLDQPQIALTLGAAAYLPKPVTQQALLGALVPWSR
jgi:CheY-like chemotaxis protein